MQSRRLFTAGAAALAMLAAMAVQLPVQAAPDPSPNPTEQRLIDEAGPEGSVRVIVQVDQLGDKQSVLDNIDQGTADVNQTYRSFPLLALDVDKKALEELAADPNVVSIQEDKVGSPSLASSIPFIRADRVQQLGFTGADQTVAILDTGIDRDHPYFAGRIVSEACYSSVSDAATQVSLCPNGTASQTGAGAADAETAQCLNGTANICRHGSHVAGIAAGSGTCVSTAVTVGAITANASGNDVDTPAGYSNRGSLLDLFAPGTSIDSSVPDDTWANFQGTSMAAPHVAGSIAALRHAYPAATAATLLTYLRDTGVDITYATRPTTNVTRRGSTCSGRCRRATTHHPSARTRARSTSTKDRPPGAAD